MSTIGRTRLRVHLPARCRVEQICLSSSALRYSSSHDGPKTPDTSRGTKGKQNILQDDVRPLKRTENQALKGDESIYPIYTDVNPLFDTYIKAQHPRSLRPDSKGRVQPFKVSTTIFNDPPLFMIDPLQRPKQKYPTGRYIKSKYRTGATGGVEDVGEISMAQMDSEDSLRKGGAAVDWGADNPSSSETDGLRETPLDAALDQQAWNTSDLYDESGRWDRRKTPHGETSSLPSPSEAQTLPPSVVATLMRFPLISKRVVQQGGKGRMPSWYVLTVAGNGDGLVGIGEGKDTENARAIEKSFIAACKDLDWVDRYENRTLWNDIDTKWGATRVILRPRPIGFGLRCNPYIHQV